MKEIWTHLGHVRVDTTSRWRTFANPPDFFALSFSFNVSIRINFSNADFPYTHPNKKPVYLRYPMQKVDLIPIFVWANLFSLFAQNRDYGRRYLFVGTAKKGFIIWHGWRRCIDTNLSIWGGFSHFELVPKVQMQKRFIESFIIMYVQMVSM